MASIVPGGVGAVRVPSAGSRRRRSAAAAVEGWRLAELVGLAPHRRLCILHLLGEPAAERGSALRAAPPSVALAPLDAGYGPLSLGNGRRSAQQILGRRLECSQPDVAGVDAARLVGRRKQPGADLTPPVKEEQERPMTHLAGAYAPCPPLPTVLSPGQFILAERGLEHDELLLVAQAPNHLDWVCRSTSGDGSAFGWVVADLRGGASRCR